MTTRTLSTVKLKLFQGSTFDSESKVLSDLPQNLFPTLLALCKGQPISIRDYSQCSIAKVNFLLFDMP